jgi:para-aminobenzoate synthetase component 1
MGLIGILSAIVQGGLIRRLLPRFGETTLAVFGPTFLAAAFVLIVLAPTWSVVIVACALMPLGFGLNNPALSGLVSRASPEDQQGAYMGLNQSVLSLARMSGPLFAGFLFKHYSARSPFLVGSGILAACALLAVFYRSRYGATLKRLLPEPDASKRNTNVRFQPCVFPLGRTPDAGELLARLSSRRALAAIDSAGGSPRRASVVAFDPLRGVAVPDSIAAIRALLARIDRSGVDSVPGPFRGGFLGALAYDLGVEGERPIEVAPDPWSSPKVAGGIYVDFVVRDETTEEGWLVLAEDPGDGRPTVAERRGRVLDALRAEAPPPRVGPAGPLVRHTPREVHGARIERARQAIAAGDYYQANLAHRFTRRMGGNPVDLYRVLRRANPAPYAGFLAFEEGAILSSSPELLLEYEGGISRTRPIKGTALVGSPQWTTRARERLLASAKDKAELAMIVDLERNDLGRACVPGSVRVEGFPRRVLRHRPPPRRGRRRRAGTRRTRSTSSRRCSPGLDQRAPKLAAMRAIADLEGEGRGFFTGSLGFVDFSGRAAWNILIRTLVWRPLRRGLVPRRRGSRGLPIPPPRTTRPWRRRRDGRRARRPGRNRLRASYPTAGATRR